MVYLLTRPIAWLFKLLMAIVLAPPRAVRAVRNHRERKRIKLLANDLKAQRKEAAAQAKARPKSGAPAA